MKSDVYDVAINENQSWNDPDCLYESARIVKKDTGEKVVSILRLSLRQLILRACRTRWLQREA